ncbi:unnamed protein product [Orchesella dallaii]|uniref:tRNA-uridine aminocarboxypropyltransferase 1 n=1 Tax=Orchesella dallaii TaxID=48710 RepID=A0ABP1PWV0_9HEXA
MEDNFQIENTRINQGINKKDAFKDYKIADNSFLDELEGRSPCPECCKSRKFFCYTCYVPMPPLVGKLPDVKLPIKIDIIKHPLEIDGKSTAVHGCILAPNDFRIHIYPELPDTQKAILVFPSDDAEDAVDFMKRVKDENNGIFPYERIIFVDSTWNQTWKIRHDPKIVNLPRIKLNGIESLFWRYQRGNPITFLSTIEAVYHMNIIFHKHFISESYNGEYDNLLFFFRYMFNKIRQLYDPKSLKAYATRPYLRE